MEMAKFSCGIGDRFGRQGQAQLRAFVDFQHLTGITLTPVWNKSNREHTIVHTEPPSVRAEADAAVKALDWKGPYHVDADHINLNTVDRFISCSDFFTIDVADLIGKPAATDELDAFIKQARSLTGRLELPGLSQPIAITEADIRRVGGTFVGAVKEAGRVYRHIKSRRSDDDFIPEISMDETDSPQSPAELLLILAAVAWEKIPIQTIAPKFTGRFNKGVNYQGDVRQFEKEFREDLAVIACAVEKFDLPRNLKLSVHSGSDKFDIYEPIRRAIRDTGAGLHVKTAGTTWLEEVIGLASAGGRGLKIARQIYGMALSRMDELCAPYATVISIDRGRLPTAEEVNGWTGEQYARALRHDPACPDYNPNMRQLVHVGFKVAAQMEGEYLSALDEFAAIISRGVKENILHRHLEKIFKI